MYLLLRIICALLLIELVNAARPRTGLGDWLPDPAIAMLVVLSMGGKVNIVMPCAIFLALLRVPATLDDPIAGAGAMLACAWVARASRRFMTREGTIVIFITTGLVYIIFQIAERAAAAARGGAVLQPWRFAAAALATAVFAVLLAPAMRGFFLTRDLMEKRFGE
ncbi:MAG: hypothetical protein HY286_15805 [Planctomycetes bacterium]|nr:hypothetical protein [Planctomycetota bacterium]